MTPPAPLPEIELEPDALVIADLHLDVARMDGGEAFARWLDQLGPVSALLVLGDLFDVWVGPAQAGLAGAPRVLDALGRLTRRGTKIYVVPGNRDFLLDASFEARTGARILPEGFVGRLGSRRIAFVHGDTLCTLDTGYLKLRRVLRSGPVGWLGPRLPLWIATRLARRLRRASVQAIAAKLPEEKSVQVAAARAVALAQRAEVVVCGHAHAFRDQDLDGGARWIVLDAFGGPRDLLELGVELRARASGVDVVARGTAH